MEKGEVKDRLRSNSEPILNNLIGTEDEQFAIYKSALQKAMGKRVIIRTLDIGADKQIDYS